MGNIVVHLAGSPEHALVTTAPTSFRQLGHCYQVVREPQDFGRNHGHEPNQIVHKDVISSEEVDDGG